MTRVSRKKVIALVDGLEGLLAGRKRGPLREALGRIGEAIAGQAARDAERIAACPLCSKVRRVDVGCRVLGEGGGLSPNTLALLPPGTSRGDGTCGQRGQKVVRCPRCGTPYLYESDHEYTGMGYDDSESVTRLCVGEALAYVSRVEHGKPRSVESLRKAVEELRAAVTLGDLGRRAERASVMPPSPGDLEALTEAARAAPGDLSRWRPLIAAFAKAGRLEEGVHLLREIAATVASPDAGETLFTLMAESGFGIGDPLSSDPVRALAYEEAGSLAAVLTAGGELLLFSAVGTVAGRLAGPFERLRFVDGDTVAAAGVVDAERAGERELLLGACSIDGRRVEARLPVGPRWRLAGLSEDYRHVGLVRGEREVLVLDAGPWRDGEGGHVPPRLRALDLPEGAAAALEAWIGPGGGSVLIGCRDAQARWSFHLSGAGSGPPHRLALASDHRPEAVFSPSGSQLALVGATDEWGDTDIRSMHDIPGMYQAPVPFLAVLALPGGESLAAHDFPMERSPRPGWGPLDVQPLRWTHDGRLHAGDVVFDPAARTIAKHQGTGPASVPDPVRHPERVRLRRVGRAAWLHGGPWGRGAPEPLAHEAPISRISDQPPGHLLTTDAAGGSVLWRWPSGTPAFQWRPRGMADPDEWTPRSVGARSRLVAESRGGVFWRGLRVRELEGERIAFALSGEGIRAAALAPRDDVVLVAEINRLSCVRLRPRRRPLWSVSNAGFVRCCGFLGAGPLGWVLDGRAPKDSPVTWTLRIFAWRTGEEIGRWPVTPPVPTWCEDRFFVAGHASGIAATVEEDGAAVVFVPGSARVRLGSRSLRAQSVAIAPSGAEAALVTGAGALERWRLPGPGVRAKRIAVVRKGLAPVAALAYSPDGARLVYSQGAHLRFAPATGTGRRRGRRT